MALPTLTGVGRLIEDAELRFSPSGVAVGKVRLAFNSRRLNKQTNEWEDGDVFYINGTLFNRAAENAAESLTKGMEVVVTGRLKTEQWTTNDGEKRSAPSLLIDSIGPSLTYATAQVTKNARDDGQQRGNGGGQSRGNGGGQSRGNGGGRRQQQADDDPWASASAFDDEPPF